MRPAVSVIVPFAGSPQQLAALTAGLTRLTLRGGDEVIVADNRHNAIQFEQRSIRVLDASGLRTPGFARNRGAGAAKGQWLLFVDADTSPAPSLLEDYFAPLPAPGTAVLAGAIRDAQTR